MENNDNNIIMSRFAFERMQAKDERNDRWRNATIIVLIILLVVTIILFVVTNAMWLIAWNQYDYVDDYSVDLDADDGGNANYIGNDGDIYNGKSDSKENEEQSSQ